MAKKRKKKRANSLAHQSLQTLMPAAFAKNGRDITKSSDLANQFSNPRNLRKKLPCTVIKFDEFGNEVSREVK